MRWTNLLFDLATSALFVPAAPFLAFAGRKRAHLRWARRLQDGVGITVVRNHYYEPVITDRDVFRPPGNPRDLPGIDWNLEGQLHLLGRLDFDEAIKGLEGRMVAGRPFTFHNSMFGIGDAEALYAIVRAFRPERVIEIGSGHSTLVVELAREDIVQHDPSYRLRHICFEPFENPWLDRIGAEVRREQIERADLTVFDELGEDDIVFIDSSHVLRAQGDVECEYLRILPRLKPGVLVHVHDIFSPRDYPHHWLVDDRKFWTEQYVLEAFLSFNNDFEILLAMNDLHQGRQEALYRAFPVLGENRLAQPGSFWFRRVSSAN